MSTLRGWYLIGLKLMLPSMKQGGQPKPSDEILRAVLLQLVPENLEEHLELNIQRFDTYSKMRAEVISFLEQKVSKSLIDDWWCSANGVGSCWW